MASGVVVVKQFERMVVLKWGRWVGNQPAGFRFLMPIIYNGRIVDLREQVDRVPTQKYITKDNVVIDLDFVLFYRVLEDQAERSVIGVIDHRIAVRSQAVADLRSIVGNISLAEALAERETIQDRLQTALDSVTGRWGLKVQGVAINEIDPPAGVKSAMEREKSAEAIKTAEITESEGQRQAAINRAEGEKQSKILEAEGHRQSEILTAQGDQQAAILRAEGYSNALGKIHEVASTVDSKTMSLQYFEVLKEMGSSPATKFVFPMEFTSMLQPFLNLGNGGNKNKD
ncbi:SPFH/Band 7/PHB domain protein [SAR202 cluster bacterium AD-804-J14_MRT_500m]|nr:SPFH/Band 7/PHB domain protein [SAR202 cluster bacterium AD-804-J14_MRT_500m]